MEATVEKDIQEITQLPIRFNEANNKNIISKSERLAFSKVDFNLNDYKIFNAFISQINPLASYPSGLDFLLTRSELAGLTGIDEKNVHKFAVKTAKKFANVKFEFSSINAGNGESEIDIINLVERARYKNGEFFVSFTSIAENELLDLKKYGSFNIEHQKTIQSRFGMVFIDLLCTRWHKKKGKTQTITLTVSEVKFACGIINEKGEHLLKSYTEFSAFRRKVILPAISDINAAGDFSIPDDGIEYIKNGRSYYQIKIDCSRAIKAPQKTHKTLPVKDRLEAHNIDQSEVEKLYLMAGVLAEYTGKNVDEILNKCLDYVEEKENINYFSNYLYEVVSLGVPFLPAWANPYSTMYKSEQQIVRTFVKAKIAPRAFEIIADARDNLITEDVFKEISLHGAFSDYFQKKLKKYKLDRR
jgi:hypothetical protein